MDVQEDILELVEQRPSSQKLKFICPYPDCNAIYSKSSKLTNHIRVHTGERPYACDIDGCDKNFTTKSYLVKHQKRPHGSQVTEPKEKKTYACLICQKDFKMKFNLKMHMTTHTGEKGFPCTQCDQRFISRSKLKRHLKSHEAYKCTIEGCQFEGDKWSILRKHMVTHKIRYQCSHCMKEFSSTGSLELHLKAHQTAYKCSECGSCYSTKSNLKAHYKTEHAGVSYSCTFEGCCKVFLHKHTLSKHALKHESHTEHTSSTKNRIQRRKKIYAKELSGIEEVSNAESEIILEADKLFRIKNKFVGI